MKLNEIKNPIVYLDNNTCFAGLDSDNNYKSIFVTVSIILIILTTPAFYTIIGYEQFGSDKKRTLMNKLVSSICWNGIVFNLTAQSLYVLRFAFGPLPSFLCSVIFVVKKTIIINDAMLLNSIALIRYIYIFWLKNPGACREDFWYIFINFWTLGFSFIFELLRLIVPGNQVLEYNLCTGDDPTTILLLPPFGRGYVEIVSCLIHIFVFAKIFIFKKKSNSRVGPDMYGQFLKNLTISDLEDRSISSISTNSFSVVVIACGAVLITIGKFKDCSDFQIFPKYLLVYNSFLILPCIGNIFIVVACYLRCPTLLKYTLREFKTGLYLLKDSVVTRIQMVFTT